MKDNLSKLKRIKTLSAARGMLNYREIQMVFDDLEKALKAFDLLVNKVLKANEDDYVFLTNTNINATNYYVFGEEVSREEYELLKETML